MKFVDDDDDDDDESPEAAELFKSTSCQMQDGGWRRQI